MKEKINEKDNYLYHNTEVLLRKYREVVWSVEAAVARAELNFEISFGMSLNEFLDMSYAAGADLSGTDIEEHMRTLERNKKMLEYIERALEFVRKKHRCGEMYYNILYLTYITMEVFDNTEDIINELAERGFYMSPKTYFKRKKEAINFLSDILWGFTSKYTNAICEEFLNRMGE